MHKSVLGNFNHLTKCKPHYFSYETLVALGNQMQLASRSAKNLNLRVAYVYLGQFIAHDISHHSTKPKFKSVHGIYYEGIVQNRSPSLDLDSLYGGGWRDKRCHKNPNSGELILGKTLHSDDPETVGKYAPGEDDLPRDQDGFKALIPDSRNDENLIVSQLHMKLIKLHNYHIKKISRDDPQLGAKELFDQARAEVTKIYQWIVAFDFLKTLCDPEIYQKVVDQDLQVYEHDLYEPLPIEFTVAAFRFGHSAIRKSYKVNDDMDLDLLHLFMLTGEGRRRSGYSSGLPANYVIDWEKMHRIFSRNIDPRITQFDVPEHQGQAKNLATRNLIRGNECGLPSGQGLVGSWIAAHPELEDVLLAKVLTPSQIREQLRHLKLEHMSEIESHTPLWFYILAEADCHHSGERLGKLGSLIVCSVITALLKKSKFGFPSITWTPAYLQPSGANLSFQDLTKLQ